MIRVCLPVLLICTALFAQAQIENIIPQPQRVEKKPGGYEFSPLGALKIVVLHDRLKKEGRYLQQQLQQQFRVKTAVVVAKSANSPLKKGNIYLQTFGGLQPNAHQVMVDANGVRITGYDNEAVFRALQTLLQIIQPNPDNANYNIESVNIYDQPRFNYRGMHLDVGRHFFPVSFIKKYIDYLATYKFNTFHWHLTEDQGWRIEIKKYPLLTSVGGCRNGTIVGRYPGTGNDSIRYCGYYTQQEIKDVVQYAADRHITIIPEIEMPGHSSAALTAYPQLGCTGGPYKVQETWGVFEEVYCAGNDTTFRFLQDVLDEVLQLFPSKYIHIGGDECPKESWKKCARCQQRIKDNNLKDEHELQSYFIQRIEKYLNSKGRNIIGWDEILEGGLAPNATVMSWRGEEGGIEAAKQKHTVIMTPGSHCYFDHSQSRDEDSVTIGGFTPLEKVYAYEPVPKELTAEQAKYVLGAQANVWTEYMKYPSKVEYMIFPRLLALSEVLWTAKEKRNWDDFLRRMQKHLYYFGSKKINYSNAFTDMKLSVTRAAEPGKLAVKLKTIKNDGVIRHRYMTNLMEGVTGQYQTEAMLMNQQAEGQTDISVGGKHEFTWLYGSDSSRIIKLDFHFNMATAQNIQLTTPPSKRYAGEDGANGLVNGLTSQKGFASPEWLGWEGGDLQAVIDLGDTKSITTTSVHVLERTGSWIYLPANCTIAISTDGVQYNEVTATAQAMPGVSGMHWMNLSFAPVSARYVRITAKNFGEIPAGKPGAGHKAWLFVDEIVVD